MCTKTNCVNVHVLRFSFKNAKIPEMFLKFFYRSFHNTYLKAICNVYERFEGFRSQFFERNNGLGDIVNWGSSRIQLKNEDRRQPSPPPAAAVSLWLLPFSPSASLHPAPSLSLSLARLSLYLGSHCSRHPQEPRVWIEVVVRFSRQRLWKPAMWKTSESFDNSYIPENPRTPKPLTFLKNRLRGLKIAQIQARSEIFFSKKTTFFSQKLCLCAKKKFAHVYILSFCFKNVQIPEIFFKIFYRSIHNTYLKGFRIILIINVLEGHEVGFFERNNGLGSNVNTN
ncbi:hypothetical protein LXL04_020048 [Taraxacum kok-saghyz]